MDALAPAHPQRRWARACALACVAALFALGPAGDAVDAAGPGVPVVFVATGADFPDALAGATLATSSGVPLLFVTRTTIPPATAAELERLEPESIVVLGGPSAVDRAVVVELAEFTEGTVTRIDGADRFDTARLISEALPERVADAEALQGLGPEAFLPADGTAADAEALQGLGPEAFVPAERFVTFSVVLDSDGEEVVVAESGPLRVVARCRLDDGGEDRVTLLFDSAEDGWFVASGGAAPRPAGTPFAIATWPAEQGRSSLFAGIDGEAAYGPGGQYLALQKETALLGLNLDGRPCVAAGAVFTHPGGG